MIKIIVSPLKNALLYVASEKPFPHHRHISPKCLYLLHMNTLLKFINQEKSRSYAAMAACMISGHECLQAGDWLIISWWNSPWFTWIALPVISSHHMIIVRSFFKIIIIKEMYNVHYLPYTTFFI